VTFLVILSINQLSTVGYILVVFIISAMGEDVHNHPSFKGAFNHSRPAFTVGDDLPSSFRAFGFSICLGIALVYFLAVSHFDHIPFDKEETTDVMEETSKKVNSPDQTISLHWCILVEVDIISVASFIGIGASCAIVRVEA
jgi:hypothetical protein